MTANTKKILITLLAIVLLAAVSAFAACDKTPEPTEIVGVTFEDMTVSYDGNEHEITVKGELPVGASVEYHYNKATAVGQYTATAIVRCEGYRTLVLDAKLTITSLTISGVTFEDKTVSYDGNEHEITIYGNLPDGVSVVYFNNKGQEVGEYKATATLSGAGYDTLTLTAKLTITKADIVGVKFNDMIIRYDGNEHEITVKGELPQGVSVRYEGNGVTSVGEHTVTATLTGWGYNTLTLTAKLTIRARNITGVKFEDVTVDFDGDEHELTIAGTLPDGVSVSYADNKATNAGEYVASATLSGVGYNPLTLTAKLTINKVDYAVVKTADELLDAINRVALIFIENDIVLDGGKNLTINKDVRINGKGHTLTAVNYSNSDYRVIDLMGDDCKNVTISNLNIVAKKWSQWLRGINVRLTENLNLKLDNVSIDLVDYYAFNITNGNSGLTVQANNVNFSAWGAVCNHGVNVTFNAVNSKFVGTNTHTGPSNGFTTVMVSDYVLYNDDAFVPINLCANNTLTFTDCEIIADIALNADGEKLVTTQKIADIRSPYNNKVTFNNCTLTRASDDDKLVYSAYDSAYIPDENRNDHVFVVDTNRVIVNGEDVTKNDDLVENYLDE